jgi:hypothetical protein
MKRRSSLLAYAAGVAMALLPALPSAAGPGKELEYEAMLVWAANTETSPDPDHKPVERDVLKKLRELPLKWKYFFEVKRRSFSLARGQSIRVTLSAKCGIEVKDIDGKHIEVSLIGKGQPVLKQTQSLPPGDMLILGGNAPDETGWLVVLKRIE